MLDNITELSKLNNPYWIVLKVARRKDDPINEPHLFNTVDISIVRDLRSFKYENNFRYYTYLKYKAVDHPDISGLNRHQIRHIFVDDYMLLDIDDRSSIDQLSDVSNLLDAYGISYKYFKSNSGFHCYIDHLVIDLIPAINSLYKVTCCTKTPTMLFYNKSNLKQ